MKGCMQVGHTGMASVACLGSQAQIGEGEHLDYFLTFKSRWCIKPPAQVSIKKHQGKDKSSQPESTEKEG